MLDLVKDESERIDAKVLEPACGEGIFLMEVLRRKLTTVKTRYGKNSFESRHYALLGLMSLYGIEILPDNAEVCRNNLARIILNFLDEPDDSVWADAIRTVLSTNIVRGDALTMKTTEGNPLVFPEWGYLGKGKFQRRDFEYTNLTERSSFSGTLFDDLSESEVSKFFSPRTDYRPVTVEDLAESWRTK